MSIPAVSIGFQAKLPDHAQAQSPTTVGDTPKDGDRDDRAAASTTAGVVPSAGLLDRGRPLNLEA